LTAPTGRDHSERMFIHRLRTKKIGRLKYFHTSVHTLVLLQKSARYICYPFLLVHLVPSTICMEFSVRSEVIKLYPTAIFGSQTISNQQNMNTHPNIEQAKRLIEKKIRETFPDPEEDPIVQSYAGYFDRWGKTYPIEFQIKSIKKGRSFPQVSTHVDCMFMAELENRILTSGHDRDAIQGGLVYDLADNGVEYVKLNGKKQVLVTNDVILRDDEGVLASVLFGPAARTSINKETVNPLYFAWCPVGIAYETVEEHLSTITQYSKSVYGDKIETARHII